MRRAFFYGWAVVAVTAIVVLITAGVRSAPVGVERAGSRALARHVTASDRGRTARLGA